MTAMTTPFAWGDSLDDLVGARVTQCALSRICGVVRAAARPADRLRRHADEVGRNAFHRPPLHLDVRPGAGWPSATTGSW